MNRRQKKLKYINLKNSWRLSGVDVSKEIVITCSHHNFEHDPRYPLSEIHLDFKDRDRILKYGVRAWRRR